MKTILLWLAGITLLVSLVVFAYGEIGDFFSSRNMSLSAQMRALTLENTDLHRRLAEKDNERLLYESAQKSNDTVNLIAQWHVFQPVILLLGGICFVVFLPVIWMGWTYALQYYIGALRKLNA